MPDGPSRQSLHGFGDSRVVVAFQGGQQLVSDTIAGELDQGVRGIGPQGYCRSSKYRWTSQRLSRSKGRTTVVSGLSRRIRGIPPGVARPVPRTMQCRIVST